MIMGVQSWIIDVRSWRNTHFRTGHGKVEQEPRISRGSSRGWYDERLLLLNDTEALGLFGS
jgi:hypothetical protein